KTTSMKMTARSSVDRASTKPGQISTGGRRSRRLRIRSSARRHGLAGRDRDRPGDQLQLVLDLVALAGDLLEQPAELDVAVADMLARGVVERDGAAPADLLGHGLLPVG